MTSTGAVAGDLGRSLNRERGRPGGDALVGGRLRASLLDSMAVLDRIGEDGEDDCSCGDAATLGSGRKGGSTGRGLDPSLFLRGAIPRFL